MNDITVGTDDTGQNNDGQDKSSHTLILILICVVSETLTLMQARCMMDILIV